MVRRQAVEAPAHQVGGDRPAGTTRRAPRLTTATPVDDRTETIRIHQGVPPHMVGGSSDRGRPTCISHEIARSVHRRGGSAAILKHNALSSWGGARWNPVESIVFILRIRRKTEADTFGGIDLPMRRPSASSRGERWRLRIESLTPVCAGPIDRATAEGGGEGERPIRNQPGMRQGRPPVPGGPPAFGGVAAGTGWPPAGSVFWLERETRERMLKFL